MYVLGFAYTRTFVRCSGLFLVAFMPSPATTYEELKETIAAAYPRLSPQLQRLSRFALEKPHDLALGTVATVAQANEVQPSSMIRFANALGFDGFSQMQQVFQSHLVERSAPYRERIRQMRRGGNAGDAGVLPQFVGDAMGELQQLEEHVDAAQLEVTDLIFLVWSRQWDVIGDADHHRLRERHLEPRTVAPPDEQTELGRWVGEHRSDLATLVELTVELERIAARLEATGARDTA